MMSDMELIRAMDAEAEVEELKATIEELEAQVEELKGVNAAFHQQGWNDCKASYDKRIKELQAQVERMEKVLKERVPRSVYEAALNGE